MDQEPTQSFAAVLVDALRARNMSADKLAAATGISERFVAGLIDESFDRLPPAPYTRGYVLRIAEVLGLDGGKLWADYLHDHDALRRSGKRDLLPENRFTTPTWLSKKLVGGLTLLLLALVYLAVRLPAIRGTPDLVVDSPRDTMVVTEPELALAGRVGPADELSVNREPLRQGPDGTFRKRVTLEPGFNTFTFEARRFLGRQATVTRQVFYQASSTATGTPPHSNGTPAQENF